MNNITLSLKDLLGEQYIASVCRAKSALTGESIDSLIKISEEKVEFYPDFFAKRQDELIKQLGETLCEGYESNLRGAPTHSYDVAQNNSAAPLNGFGCYRIGEDGKLYFAGKSEHYHIPLGHAFPGYELIEKAKRLGIPNATHNNTRGYVTRLAERTLIACANGVEADGDEIEAVLQKIEPGLLNCVINLETGSLAVEAALKMMLSRFYTIDGKSAEFSGRTPVFIVMADNANGITAGYHGTTVTAQSLRGLWPDYLAKVEEIGLYKVVAAPINDAAAFSEIIEKYNKPPYKTAGFCHEIIMMNYGGIRLSEEFLHSAYADCRRSSTPVLCDEIQSCAWYDGLFLFRKYGLSPDFVSIGKGFPGGTYPASKILTSSAFDSLNQFGALVTNGQEELASLAYLITIEFIKANGQYIEREGHSYHEKVGNVIKKHSAICPKLEGDAHMTALCFENVDEAVEFCKIMNGKFCVDISAQTYKPNCPPVALTKLPLIVSDEMTSALCAMFDKALCMIENGGAK